jgi:glycosyltransferase involved in cell wall biosynthesis
VDLSFVIITYNDAALLPRAISSAAQSSAHSGLNFEIIVVDNGSEDHTQEVLRAFEDVLGDRLRVISLGYNSGTTFSRNRALELAQGRFICVMDSDAEFLDPDLKPICGFLAGHPQAGIVGPRIIMPDGSTYNSAKLFPTLGDKLMKLPSIFLGSPALNRDWYPDFPFSATRCVHSVISCCWFLRRDLYELIGPLDERIFYAPEDVDYCLRSWRAERPVIYYPHLKVLHNTKQVSHKKPFSKTARSHLKGLLYYYNKHGYWFSRDKVQRRWIDPALGLCAELRPGS